jgi:hypothetical protein
MVFGSPNPIKVAQQCLRAPDGGLTAFNGAIVEIVVNELWRSDGQFAAFGEFAVARTGAGGLEVRTVSAALMLRGTLLRANFFEAWMSTVEQIGKPPGRPRKISANSDTFVPFYTVARSPTSVDRTLTVLKEKHPELFERLCAGEMKVSGAAQMAGLRPSHSPGKLRFNAVDFGALAHVGRKSRVTLLLEIIQAMGPETLVEVLRRTVGDSIAGQCAAHWPEMESTKATAIA